MKQWLISYLFNEYPPIWISSWGILFLLIGTLIILIIILKSRIQKTRKIYLQEKYKEEFEGLLTSFIFDEEEYELGSDNYNEFVKALKKNARNALKHEVLISTILLLHHDFKGSPAQRLVKLYHDVGLQQYAFRQIKFGSWYEKAFEFTELGQMQVQEGLPLVLDYIDHYSTVLREEAQFAAVRMGGVENIRFLSTLNKSISDWQQTRIMQELDQFSNEEIPSFYYLLDARNDTTIIFGMKLIAKYHQIEDQVKIAGLLWHENIKVAVAAMECLIDLDYFPVADDLPNLFYTHTEEYQPLVLRALGRLGNKSHIPFLEGMLTNEDYDIVMEATKALIRLGYVLSPSTTLSDFNKEIYKHARYELVP